MPSKSSPLTKKQAYWLSHLRECEAGGHGLAAYARSQGLRPQQLYTWSTRLRALGIWDSPGGAIKKRPTEKPTRPTPRTRPEDLGFVTARIAPSAPSSSMTALRIRFANGIILEVGSGGSELPDPGWLSQLAALP